MLPGTSGNRIDRMTGPRGFPLVRLSHASGYSAVIAEYGAHVVSWRDPQERELLFLSDAAVFENGKAIRGGIPLVFPQFSDGKLPKHGFARTMIWRVVREQVSTSGPVMVTLRLVSDPRTLEIWPHQFQAEVDIVVTDVLLLTLRVENIGAQPFTFTSALHTYFRTEDVSGVSVCGLEQCEFVDMLRQRKMDIERRAQIPIDGPIDRVYRDSPQSVQIHSERDGTTFLITKEGFSDTVVWNPWVEGAKAIADLGDDEYTKMVCVESGNILSPITLSARELHTSAQILRVE
jgi:glucose-6-phosphate 1-epimerase